MVYVNLTIESLMGEVRTDHLLLIIEFTINCSILGTQKFFETWFKSPEDVARWNRIFGRGQASGEQLTLRD